LEVRFVQAMLNTIGRKLHAAALAIVRGVAGLFRRARRSLHVEETDDRSAESDRVFRRQSYPGSRTRRFELHLPRAYSDNSSMPLVMVLHGCRQNSADIRRISNFDAVADREGFVVVYPFVTGYSGIRIRNCWGWWLDSEIRPGAGEVEDLWQIVEQVKKEVSIDRRRIHIAGLSSGGAMAVAAMVVHRSRFASGAAVAGVAYSETPRAVSYPGHTGAAFKPTGDLVSAMKSIMGEHGRPSPIFIVHSHGDSTVDIQAARNLRDSWARCFGIDTDRPGSRSSGTSGGVSWVQARYREPWRRSAVETLFIEGREHGWYGGNPGNFSFPEAPDISDSMWRFFKRHPLYSRSRVTSNPAQMFKAG
jgi:poly(hydroxyalkanoate) depolymerase family esterase